MDREHNNDFDSAQSLTQKEQRKLRQLIDKLGEREAAAKLGVHPKTLARCLAGLPVRSTTRGEVIRRLGDDA